MNLAVCTTKSWNIEQAEQLRARMGEEGHRVSIWTDKRDLNQRNLESAKPDYIFFPHWSHIIPREVYSNYQCVVFHMTDLPFGRGGSPLQNLIVRGIKDTKISALRVDEGIDTGPIYLKRPLSLEGSAEEVYRRASRIVFEEMIPEIVATNPIPVAQEGEVTLFKRRTPDQSELDGVLSLEEVFDRIRMLDAEGYPRAFIRMGELRLEFDRAQLDSDSVVARVVIRKETHG